MDITAISFVEEGDERFRLSFMYGDANLKTGFLQRTASKAEVKDALRTRLHEWKDKRADLNYQALKDEFDGGSIHEGTADEGEI